MSFLTFDTESNQRKSFELPGAKPHYNPDRPGQVNHIFLDLKINLAERHLQGVCRLTLTPVRPGIQQLVLDAVDLKIAWVLMKGVSQHFDHDGDRLTIDLLQPLAAEPVTLEIQYELKNPRRGIYFIQPDRHYPEKPVQVWTQGEDEDSRYWFPCFDYPGQLATSEIRVQVAKPYRVISNGSLIEQKDLGNEQVFHWSQTQIHPTYLMTLAIGDFAEIADSYGDLPVRYYVEKGREDDGQRSMGKTPRMIEFFNKAFGYPYAYPNYDQVCVADFIFGGMENTSTTLLMDRCLLDERAALDNRNTESLVAHELAHQWFGDLVVIKHWSHAWLKEGMASYAEVLWTDHEYGQDEAAYYLLGEARNYLAEDSSRYRRPIVTHVYREAIELYDRHLYEKGACVYHTIRTVLGDELFFKAVHTFVQDNAHSTVETIDLLRAIEKATGFNLLWLFDQYVFRGGHPEFKVSYSWDNDNKLAKLTITQTQAKADSNHKDLFNLKIPVAFNFLEAEKITTQVIPLQLKEREQVFYFPLHRKPDFVSFDQGNNFLKTVELAYPLAELKAQCTRDPDPISRIQAAIAIAKQGGLEAVEFLGERLQKESFWGVRVEIAEQLAGINLDQVGTLLSQGLAKNDHPKVRRAIIASLAKIKTSASYEAIKKCLAQGEASYYAESAAASALGALGSGLLKDNEGEIIEQLTAVLQTRPGWNEVVRCGAIAGLSQLTTSPQAVDTILTYTANGVSQPLRLASIRALGAVSVGQSPEKLTEILEQLTVIAQEEFFLTQVSVTAALGQMETPKAIGILQNLANQTPDGRVRRMAEEAVKKVQAKIGSDEKIKDLQTNLEKLQQENQDLQSRLAKLETQFAQTSSNKENQQD
ncbi:M1 family metallopeptidase [Synechocystis sp. PCC 7338]|uniref:M1 family metallopeptidase n=1 Tax=Synechocystis sp. PCC 7338 TaxID=2732530 RepID=UPI001BAF15AC|nr:M1 family metallopeptidase [Synechocystis sp. PCC 7338]QUS60749.1 M1 family metallopeptidase [Synechocystis sp. PCC 7338]